MDIHHFSGRDVSNGVTVATELVLGIVPFQWHRRCLLSPDKAKELKKKANSLMIGYLLRAASYYIVIGVLALGVGLPLVFADFMSCFGVPAAVAITVLPIAVFLLLYIVDFPLDMEHTMVGLVILKGGMALTRSLAMLMSLITTAYVYKHAAGRIEA